MASALGIKSTSGTALISFVKSRAISQTSMGQDILEKASNPLIFKGLSMGANMPPPRPVHGYDVVLLIDICKAILAASADGLLKNDNVIRQANVIISASAKAGIKGLVYALAGYDATRQEVIESYKLYVQEEAREYEKEFPDQLYQQWYRIYKIPKPIKNKPWEFMHLTNKHVYYPLANSSGKLQDLIKSQRSGSKEHRRKRLHQFLSEVGVKALRQHLGQILAIAQLSDTIDEYERNLKKIFPSFGSPQLEFNLDDIEFNIDW